MQVRKAYGETLHVKVAAKEVQLRQMISTTEQAEGLLRAEREARRAAALRDHANSDAVHDVAIEGEGSLTVMQLVVRHALEDRLNMQGPLSNLVAAMVATELLNTLGATHAAGIVRWDVKQANVMLSDNGEVLITDFRIATPRLTPP
ncbi:serine/threonine protein kinase [Streptomyces umbrinus]|uniref:Serine/threonine protein kinase n=1 Tax=Streptomyces umbrinus TaxID=67370 RepID=A0ABU0SME3_9ACTN|nr:hypothetical protein [Streptomyces umbrinus]MDQ1024721.1 serine/threonine protein kinase [Streptomyces umbrinus]